MSKTKISEYSATANSNTDVGGINIDEGCAPSGINDAIRTMMAQLKNFQTGTGGDSFNGPVGSTTAASGAFTTLSATGVATFSAGSASAPALTTSGDTNTGIAFPAADTVALTTGGTERARVDSSGNLGLGVTPSAWSGWTALDMKYATTLATSDSGTAGFGSNWYNNGTNYIYKSSGYAGMYLSSSASSSIHRWFTAASGTAGNAITFTQAMTLDASGNLALGSTSADPLSRSYGRMLGISSATTAAIEINSATGNAAYFDMGVNGVRTSELYTSSTEFNLNAITSIPMTFATGNTERARIDSSGNLLVGTTSASAVTNGGLVLNFGAGESYTMAGHKTGTSSGAYFHACYYNNTLCGGLTQSGTTGVVLTSISDYRLKDDVETMQGSLAKVLALNPVKYKWKSDNSDGEGFIAHELQAVISTAATGVKDEVDEEGNAKYQGINLSAIVPHLVKAMQELKAELDAAKARITTLEA